jgi:predicted NBD/HSP70 family sugar kinase
MSEFLYGLADIGGTQDRVVVVDNEMRIYGVDYGTTNVEDYEGTLEGVADRMERLADGKGELVAASLAVAAELDNKGQLVRAGGLSPWIGRFIARDTAVILGMPEERVGGLNDLEAVGKSQVAANRDAGIEANGIVTTLSSGWGGARYTESGLVIPDEPGHQHLRNGDVCPCGKPGHAEAYVSGNGIQGNKGVDMRTWLEDPRNTDQFVDDLSSAVVSMLERHYGIDGFETEEIRWMGGVAVGQPMAMWRVHQEVLARMGKDAPVWEMVSMGHQAGLHGTFIDAHERAQL